MMTVLSILTFLGTVCVVLLAICMVGLWQWWKRFDACLAKIEAWLERETLQP